MTALNGKEALNLIYKKDTNNIFDMILIDNIMPIMDGPSLARELRSRGYDKLLIGVTGNVLPEDVDEFLQAGIDLVLNKPIKINILKTLLEFCAATGSKSYSRQKLRLQLSNDKSLLWIPY